MLDLVGDWGQATFHRILGWLTQEFCDRTGPKSRSKIWSIRGGGVEAVPLVHDGEADVAVVTPAKLMPAALQGEGIFAPYGPMPHLRALGVLPQSDRMILAVHPKFGVRSFEDIRNQKPALKLATSENDGQSFIGYVAATLLDAHGLDQATIESWGGQIITGKRPQLCFKSALDGTADALIQEAIMLSDWNELVERRGWIPIPVETEALHKLTTIQRRAGFHAVEIRPDHWATKTGFQAADFSDFLLVVRDDMPDDVAALLTWCMINTRSRLEAQFNHVPADKCALTYPINPVEMAKSSIPLHPAAKKVYEEAGYLS